MQASKRNNKPVIKKITTVVEKTNTGFSAYAKEFPIYTTGQTVPELMNNAYEATECFFEDDPQWTDHYEIIFEIDFQQFFKYYKVINAKFLATRIGMNASLLSQYVRGHKKPSPKQANKILTGIQQIGQELAEINLLQKIGDAQ